MGRALPSCRLSKPVRIGPKGRSGGSKWIAVNLIQTERELEDVLTQPRQDLVNFIRNVSGTLVILGAGGKMGPTLAVLAHRAAEAARHPLNIIAASRFSDSRARSWLEERGVKTIEADLLDQASVEKLPDAAAVIYLAGFKFGAAKDPSLAWAINTLAPARSAERYASARIVALSTGNVYPLININSGGAIETTSLTPVGEYANAAVARERVFEYFARKNGTAIAIIRLSYAVELRYGVLVDIARKVWAGEPLDLSNGYFNCIWQSDANEMILRAFALPTSPPEPWNLTGTDQISVRSVAEKFSRLFDKPARFGGTETDTAFLSNSARLRARLGPPTTSLETMVQWIAHWIKIGGRLLDKPTRFEVRDGKY